VPGVRGNEEIIAADLLSLAFERAADFGVVICGAAGKSST